MSSADLAPAGDGDTASWFKFYKWDVEGEVFVPRKSPFLEAEPGDILWFVLDKALLGCVPIGRAEVPVLPTHRQEIWYDASQIEEFEPPFASEWLPLIREMVPDGSPATEQVSQEVFEAWRSKARKRS